jgi:hypothetical protein
MVVQQVMAGVAALAVISLAVVVISGVFKLALELLSDLVKR